MTLRCLNRLRALAHNRLLLLSADKGYSREEELLYLQEPYIATHGAVFSMMVNYHAIGEYFVAHGGEALHPSQRHRSLNISAFTSGLAGEQVVELRSAYGEAIDGLSPDDFFTLVSSLREDGAAPLSPTGALALVRLSQWDADVLLRNLPALLESVDKAPEAFREELYWSVRRVWDSYYPIGETWDLASYIGMLFYNMRYYPQALEFLEYSLRLYGPAAATLHDMALCYWAMHQPDKALEYVQKTLELDPAYDAAKGLQVKIQSDMKRHGQRPAAGAVRASEGL